MNNKSISVEEKQFIRQLFGEMRQGLNNFMNDRNFHLSNPQIFTFITYCPTALAIASDRKVDETEIAALEKISKSVDVRSMVNLDLMEMMSYAPEPDNCIINEEFNIRVASEILFLSRNMDTYESSFINAIKALLKFDSNPKAEESMTKSFVKMMNAIIENNVSQNKEEELENLKAIQKKIGLHSN